MNILITGYRGFIGRNLIDIFNKLDKDINYLLYDKNNSEDELKKCVVNVIWYFILQL